MDYDPPMAFRGEILTQKSKKQENKPIEIFYKKNNKVIKLSNWCDFFIKLGKLINYECDGKSKFIVVLALPTRSFCSAFISLGYIINRIYLNHDDDNFLHINYLKNLPSGTSVILRSANGKKYKGLLLGHCSRNGVSYFEIAFEKKANRYVEFKDSRRIEVINTIVNLPRSQRGRTLIPESDFCSSVLGAEYIPELTSESNFEVAIIGPKNLLQQEVTCQDFSTCKGNEGKLQEIIRLKEFQSSANAYRSRIISDRIKAVKIHSSIEDPPLVIFDGAQGFLKWRTYWKQSNWIIILDRTEYQFQVAVDQINREYVLYRAENIDFDPTQFDIPVGVEMMAYKVRN